MIEIPIKPTVIMESSTQGSELSTAPASIAGIQRTPSKPDKKSGFFHYFANPRHNLRSTFNIAEGSFEIKKRVPLTRHYGVPDRLIGTNDRILAVSRIGWYLYDSELNLLCERPTGFANISIGDDAKHFYLINDLGALACRGLHDGSVSYLIIIPLGKDYFYPLMYQWNSRILLVGIEKKTDPRTPGPPPEYTRFDVLKINTPVETDEYLFTSSYTSEANFAFGSRHVSTAVTHEKLIIIMLNTILISDWSGKIVSHITATFQPHALSIDESDYIYLIVTDEKNKKALWCISAKGQLVSKTLLPPAEYSSLAISYDHHAFCIYKNGIVAVDQNGMILWNRTTMLPFGGPVVMPDNRLCLAEGSAVTVWDEKGTRNILFPFIKENVSTQPFIVESGNVIIVTEKNIYLLAPKK